MLHRANKFRGGPEFYAVKDRVLRRWGVLVGHDLQLFAGSPCWDCDSRDAETGDWQARMLKIEGWSPEDHDCERCGCTGWYRLPRYVVLERWVFGGHVFHRPLARPQEYAGGPLDVPARMVIHGRIPKDQFGGYDHRYGRDELSTLALMLLFNTRYGWRMLRSMVWYCQAMWPVRRWWCRRPNWMVNTRWRFSEEWRAALVDWGFKRGYTWEQTRLPLADDDLPF